MTVDDSSSSSSFRELDDVFLQSQARIWLGEVLHTSFDEQLSICDLLSDGELLPVDTRKSSGRYRPYSNVDAFLKVCKVLGLSGVDLFSPSDVVEQRDTRKVCICIRSLSKKARSKQLNVPDFDIVTKTVSMPTNVVRCIRRSLELSTSSLPHGQSKHSRLKIRQKSGSASQKQEDKSCREESDDAKSNFSDTTYADFMYLELGESSEALDKYAPTQGTQQPDTGSQGIDKFGHKPRSVESLLFQYVNCDSQSEGVSSPACESRLMISNEFTPIHEAKNWYINGENALSPQNIGEVDHHISLSDMVSFRIFTNATFHVAEDCLCHSCMHSESHNSNTTPNTSMYRLRRRFSDDVEVSSTSSVGSVVGRVLDFDVDFHANSEPDDLRTSVSITPDLQQLGARRLCKVAASCNKFLESPFETKFSSWCWDDPKSYCSVDQDFESLNQISQAQKKFKDSLILVKDNVTNVADNIQETVVSNDENDKLMNGVKMADLKLTCEVNDICNDRITVKSSEKCDWIIQHQSSKGFGDVKKEDDQQCTNQSDEAHCYVEGRTKAASQDEIKDYDIDNLVEANTNGRKDKRTEKKPTYVTPLLKTVAKGTALISIILLLHFSRNRSDENTNNKPIEKSSQIHWKSSGVGLSRRKGEKGSQIYPFEQFKFGD